MAKIKNNGSKDVCIRPGCGKVVKARGLCAADYSTVRRLINEDRVTEDLLVASKKILPRGHGTITQWFETETGVRKN